MGVPVSLVLLDKCLGLGVDGKDRLVLLVADSIVDVAGGCEVAMLKEFSEGDACVTLALVVFIPHSGYDLLGPEKLFLREGPPLAMVTLLYCSMSSLYTPGGSVLGILSPGSLAGVAAGAGTPVVAGPAVVVWMFLLMALCVATRDALRASR